MPQPTPRKNEKPKDWDERCMGDKVMKREYPDRDQRYAVCRDIWRREKGDNALTHSIDSEQLAAAAAPVLAEQRRQECAAQHFGPWAVEPQWFEQAVTAVREGTWQPMGAMGADHDADLYEVTDGDVAVISIQGQMTKGDSSFGGASTVRTRRAVRQAAQDDDVRAILLHIDSPGGTVAGTADLADDVRAADQQKPVHAHIDDLGASAAYWVASQARRITANRTARVGSIGTVAVVQDLSGQAAMKGIKVHVISTGAYKGMLTPGSAVTDAQLGHVREIVEGANEHFLAAVRSGRGLSEQRLKAVADGRTFLAEKARFAGLIDAVGTLDEAVSTAEDHATGGLDMGSEDARTTARLVAEQHPEAVAELKKEAVTEAREKIAADAADAQRKRFEALATLYGERTEALHTAFLAGKGEADAKAELFQILQSEAAEQKKQLAAREEELKKAREAAAERDKAVAHQSSEAVDKLDEVRAEQADADSPKTFEAAVTSYMKAHPDDKRSQAMMACKDKYPELYEQAKTA